MEGKPKILILGATGFVGRNLVKYLIENDLAEVTAVDKVFPNCAYLSKEEEKIFEKANFQQKNLISPDSVNSLWEGATYDYCVNLAAETKYGHNDEVYAERVLGLSVTCAKAAAEHGIKRFVEVSTAMVYEPTEKKKDESGKIAPWTNIAKHKLEVEKELANIAGLNYVILRPAIIYGPGDRYGVAPRIICGAIYKHISKPMKFLWSANLAINTVHVSDVCRAIFHVLTAGDSGAIYNLADKSHSNQGSINKSLEELFGIETKFAGKMLSKAATGVSMKKVTAEVNDRHVAPWAEMCKAKDISFTPLSPYLDQELLYKKHLSVDGSAIESTGFKYEVPEVTTDLLREWVVYNTTKGHFPDGYLA